MCSNVERELAGRWLTWLLVGRAEPLNSPDRLPLEAVTGRSSLFKMSTNKLPVSISSSSFTLSDNVCSPFVIHVSFIIFLLLPWSWLHDLFPVSIKFLVLPFLSIIIFLSMWSQRRMYVMNDLFYKYLVKVQISLLKLLQINCLWWYCTQVSALKFKVPSISNMKQFLTYNANKMVSANRKDFI